MPAKMLPMKISQAAILSTLPPYYRDPFERMLVAQALAAKMPLVSVDARLDAMTLIEDGDQHACRGLTERQV
jgi:PIN domain nuclease of toxin-antitoxin system